MHVLVWGPSRRHRELAEFCKAELLNEYGKLSGGRSFKFDQTWLGDSCLVCKVKVGGNTLAQSVASSVLVSSFARIERVSHTLEGALADTRSISHAYNVDERCSLLANRQLRHTAQQKMLSEATHATENQESAIFLIDGMFMVGTILYHSQGKYKSSPLLGSGPTTLDPELSRLSLQFANVSRGSIVLDPCCGSGSIPIAARQQYNASVLFSDVDSAAVFMTTSADAGDGLVADVMRLRFRETSIDAIVTDVPYGHREEIRGCACEVDMVEHIAEEAQRALVAGGRLVVWTHTLTDRLLQSIKDIGLNIVFCLREKREKGIQRQLLVCKKDGAPVQFQSRRPIQFNKHVVPKKNLQRHVPYRLIREQKDVLDVWRCAWLGDTASLERYFREQNGNANVRDEVGRTPILFACGYGRAKAAILLLDKGADPNLCDSKSKMNAIHRAAARGHCNIVQILGERDDTDLLATSACGQNAMHYSAQFGWTDTIDALLRALSRRGETVACLMTADEDGRLPLHLACQWGKHKVVERLLKTEIYDPNAKTLCQSQWSAAHIAARWGHIETLEVLKLHGANMNCLSGPPYYSTPMEEAVRWGRNLNYSC